MQLAQFPVAPELAKAILASCDGGCSEEMLSIAAMISVPSVFDQSQDRLVLDYMRRCYAVYEGDHLTYLNSARPPAVLHEISHFPL